MNNRTQIRIFTIIGILLIYFGLTTQLFSWTKVNINESIEDCFDSSYKSTGFEIRSDLDLDKMGYEVWITLNDENNWFTQDSWCGCIATEFLTTFKRDFKDLDEEIFYYHFIFLAENENSSKNENSNIQFTADYANDQNKTSIYQIPITLYKDGKAYASRTYLEYYKDWSSHEYLPYAYPYQFTPAEGEHYKLLIDEEASTYSVEPISAADTERNPDSSLMWYMDEFSSYFFTINNIEAFTECDATENRIDISLTFSNQLDDLDLKAFVKFYIYNGEEELIGMTDIQTSALLPGESENLLVSEAFTDETPFFFKIVYVVFSQGSVPNKIIVFE